MKKKRIPAHRKRFGATVRERRLALGLSQEILAEKVGCHRNYMGRIERGEQNITLDMMIRVARGLRWSLNDLTKETEL